jgi:hypothetical protein
MDKSKRIAKEGNMKSAALEFEWRHLSKWDALEISVRVY